MLKKYSTEDLAEVYRRNVAEFGKDEVLETYDYVNDTYVMVPEPDEKTLSLLSEYAKSDVIINGNGIGANNIVTIIEDETDKYLHGEQDEKQTAEAVQKKVTLFLNEIA